MKKALVVLGFAFLLLGGILLLRENSDPKENPFSKSLPNIFRGRDAGPYSPVPGTVLGSTETALPCGELVERYSAAREKRDWREVLRLRRWFSSLDPDQLLPLVRLMEERGEGLLLGRMLELAFKNSDDRHFRRELTRVVMFAVDGMSVETLAGEDRPETLHLMAVYGGANGASRLLSIMGTHAEPEVKQAAALSLGNEGSTVAVPHLKLMADQGDLDLSGIYAILALEKIGRRTATPFSVAQTGAWKNSLARTIEFDSDSKRVGESLVVLSRLYDRGTNEMLVSLLNRESSSRELRRRALAILAREGTEEDLENLPREGDLLPEIGQTRRAIESRTRSREK